MAETKRSIHFAAASRYDLSLCSISYTWPTWRCFVAFPAGDNDLVIQWQAADRAFDLAQKHALEEQLEPLRRAYQALPTMQRLGFELWVLSVLRRRS